MKMQAIQDKITSHQHLISPASLRVLLLSAQSFISAARNPYVVEKLKRYVGPVLLACLGVYIVGAFLTIPIKILARLVRMPDMQCGSPGPHADTVGAACHE